jgi:MEDS: MEthanogen/methylotroph, DcmR Sensory domain
VAAEALAVNPGDHVVAFYADDSELGELASEFLASAIKDGGVAIVLATPEHQRLLAEWLQLAGVDVPAARSADCLITLDAARTIDQFVVNGWADPASFWAAIRPVIRQATAVARPVRVYGEMVSLLWGVGLVNVAVEVEALWNELAVQYPFALLCAYPAITASEMEQSDALTQVCAVHSALTGLPAELRPNAQDG